MESNFSDMEWKAYLINEEHYVYARSEEEAIETLIEESEPLDHYDVDQIDVDAVLRVFVDGKGFVQEELLSRYIVVRDRPNLIDVSDFTLEYIEDYM